MTVPSPPSADRGAAPIGRGERITNLDTVRGVATLGILVMNAVSYGLPEAAYFNLDAAGSGSWLDWTVGVLGEILVDQKTMALFSLLFGAGIVVFADRAEAKGRRPVWLSLWRNLLLFGFGVLHTLLWDGDILTVYAICAPVLLLLRKRSPRTLLISGTALVVLSAVWATLTQLLVDITPDELGSIWFVDGGTSGDAVGLFFIADFFLRALGMMLVGVALYRLEIVQGTRPAAYYRRMAVCGLGVGLPLAALGVAIQFAGEWGVDTALVGAAPNTLATIPIALGYLAVITLWNQAGDARAATGWQIPVHERLRAVGRMALTNYLTQTIIGIVVLRGVLDAGPDGSRELGRAAIFGFVLIVWAVQVLWSKPWLDRFRFGPFEWLWRVLTYRRMQPLVRAREVARGTSGEPPRGAPRQTS
ncbi:MAG: DUF418 domain-containing protein [Actinomycetota bacterium]